jgi:CBS domain-containing protein
MRAPAPELDPGTELAEALEQMRRGGDSARLVKTGPAQWESAAARGGSGVVRDLIEDKPLPRLYPDMPLETALAYLARYPILPVASRADAGRLLGAVTLEDVQRALLLHAEERGK